MIASYMSSVLCLPFSFQVKFLFLSEFSIHITFHLSLQFLLLTDRLHLPVVFPTLTHCLLGKVPPRLCRMPAGTCWLTGEHMELC